MLAYRCCALTISGTAPICPLLTLIDARRSAPIICRWSPRLAMTNSIIIRFWKPYGVLTKFTDEQRRTTLANYINMPGIYAAGRLDQDSEGLLLLTNSGALNARLTNP